MRARVAIVGGSGYGGSELLRILLQHPKVEVAAVYANEHAGKEVFRVHKNLFRLTELVFQRIPEDISQLEVDVIFFALPHGHAMKIIPKVSEKTKVIDLSGDFRLKDYKVYEELYGRVHEAVEIQSSFVYGLAETNRDLIRRANRVANPGCFATATILALAPIVKKGLFSGRIIVDAKTGSSGSGAKPAQNTHHPERMNSFYAYKLFQHQHKPEIEQHLAEIGDFSGGAVLFVTHSMPVSRGIFVSCYLETKEELECIEQLYRDFYKDDFFIRIVEDSPDINWVKMTNFCDIAAYAKGNQAVIFSAIDNLVKGAAGQAVQNMNLMLGFDEREGLISMGSRP
ncbi:MAG: N-acetyl-gamma-glutamyl-phosphate reductase [Pyrinomonadaceae bacterium]|nr:N-acetyl-gamma-glutamyl-phosphate reductase [Pyrinomonadaceae bacterium]MCX7640135.1 N-acetyl-gamma-glutamyl-phosphate reductase [Pyrinomonadaceae bacterium]MDW8303277.1 N-acetyl-gamma-glutamyl-phosphate reductase [Acidobacteriota bacterium]